MGVVKKSAGVRMVSVLFRSEGTRQPRYLTFRECHDYAEDPIRRDMRPSFPYIFELGRLAVNYNLERLPTVGRNSQVGVQGRFFFLGGGEERRFGSSEFN